MENIWKERTKKVKAEMDDCLKQKEFETCSTQIESCLDLLVPTVENFLFHDQESDLSEEMEEASHENQEGENREHGFVTRKIDIPVVFTGDKDFSSKDMIVKNNDNHHVLENLKDQYNLLKNRLLPKVKKWSITLTKAGIPEATELLKKVIDIKQELEYLDGKVSDLDVFKPDKEKTRNNHSDSDESDFEEVPDKEGYEEDSKVECDYSSHLRDDTMLQRNSSISSKHPSAHSTDKQEEISNSNANDKNSSKEKKLFSKQRIPRDIEEAMKVGWDEDSKRTKIIVHSDLNRVWGTAPAENEIEVPCSSGLQRVVDISSKIGDFLFRKVFLVLWTGFH